MPTPTSNIRNFCIIAHIDHGKSTLADQFLLKTGTISERDIKAQTLDSMDLERERGITIRMHPVTIYHEHNGQKYELNLIDTPGHVDFNYEVSRSLAACEGAVLLVDATQGVQAQTVANSLLAMNGGLEIIPVLNKIDLATAHPDECVEEIENVLGLDRTDGPAPRLRQADPHGLRGDLSDLQRRPPPPEEGPREAPPERRELRLRAGEVGGARVRLPLRLPGPPPHGDRPGAPRARVERADR